MSVHNSLLCLPTCWSMCGNPRRPRWPERCDLPDPVVTLLLVVLTWHQAPSLKCKQRLQLPYSPLLLCHCSIKTKRRLKYAGDHAASCAHAEIIRHFGRWTFHLGGYCYSHSFEMPSSEEECWLDSVTFHYRHACLPKIREDASVNIVGDLGMTASRSLNINIRIAGCSWERKW